jgi:hypothetical protein
MIGFSEAPQAWPLTQRAAKGLGVNLTEAVVDGWLSRGELRALVQTCAACGQTCASATLPIGCANKSALEALR